MGLADGSYASALDRLRELAAEHARSTPDDFATQVRFAAAERRAEEDTIP
ncbi:MAG TPA: hypothetical protein VK548_07825 [Candidatus Acidoferrum sp.]|nr:hypothetical protein [Candidatus Acidoferrum sp.]